VPFSVTEAVVGELMPSMAHICAESVNIGNNGMIVKPVLSTTVNNN
jgi:hypothetical protein